MEKQISDRGYYPVRLSKDEVEAWNADPSLVDARFKDEMLRNVERWMALADERLEGKGIRCIVSPANDDMFEIDPIIAAAKLVELGEANTIALDGFSLVSTGWANPTPWKTFRELPEDELRARIDGLVAEVPDPQAGDLQLPRPAVRLEPRLGAAARCRHEVRLRRPGAGPGRVAGGPRFDHRTTARSLSLHGHIHEGRGAVKIGRTLAVNPGSTYEDGVLQAAIVDLDVKKGEVKRYLLING